jgi:DNA-binding response OmpR family regulator
MDDKFSKATAKVLIIEDNASYAEELRRVFLSNYNELSFEVHIASSELEANKFILKNKIDVYIVDLELPEHEEHPSEEVGERLVRRIVRSTDGGVIVHTGILRADREDFLWGGVDDFIQKGDAISEVAARTFSVWRRVTKARKATASLSGRARLYRIGKWKFEEGNRDLVSNFGETARLSPTELAFIQYLCTVDTEIDRREFNIAVLARPAHEVGKRIDNLIYRLREKLGNTFQIISRHTDGAYKLIDVEQLE